MQQYLDLLQHILDKGQQKSDRTGTGTISVFGYQMRFNLEDGFPMVTTKKLHLKSIIHELLWFIKGDTNVKYLQENGVRIWDEWARADGSLGPVYGKQWRQWENKEGEVFDQLMDVIHQIKTNPDSRRMIVSAWNVGELKEMALMPCHALFQFYVADGKLSCQLYQRSADWALGVPFNWVSYSILTHIFAHLCNLEVGEFIWTGGDVHIYENQIEALKTQFNKNSHALPQVVINPNLKNLEDLTFEDISIEGYVSEEHIKIPVSQ